jgi:hypothetical protein
LQKDPAILPEIFITWGFSWDLSITVCDKNQTKLNTPLFRLSMGMIFVQGNPFQPFNPIGENRP